MLANSQVLRMADIVAASPKDTTVSCASSSSMVQHIDLTGEQFTAVHALQAVDVSPVLVCSLRLNSQ